MFTALDERKSRALKEFKNLLITEIAMPGSHDALTYRVGKEKRASGKKNIALKIPLVGSAIAKLSKAQGDNMSGQFSNGSRYFDIRIAKTKNGFEGVHGLYNGPVEKSFRDFKDFLQKHPGEIVLLDINHIDSSQLDEFMHLMKDIFGSMVYPRTKGSIEVPYHSFIASGQRVIFFAKDAERKDGTLLAFDRKKFLRSQWHNEQDPKKLKAIIIEFEKKNARFTKRVHVIQAQTTPNIKSGALSIAKSILTFGKKGGLGKSAKKDRKYQEQLLDTAKNDKQESHLLRAINVFMVDHLKAKKALKIIALNDEKVKRASK